MLCRVLLFKVVASQLKFQVVFYSGDLVRQFPRFRLAAHEGVRKSWGKKISVVVFRKRGVVKLYFGVDVT